MPNAQEVLDWIKWDKKRKANMTNEKYIRTCSTEELATVIYGIAMYDMLYDRIHNAFVLNPCEDDSAGINEVMKWLKEKHDGE